MNLTLSLEQSRLTWTLKPDRNYVVGQTPECDVRLPLQDKKLQNRSSFRIEYANGIWHVRPGGRSEGIFINGISLVEMPFAIKKIAYINLPNGHILTASLSSEVTSVDHESSSLVTSMRLLSGNAYMRGISSGFELLNQLRSDPYKAKIPDAGLDLNKIAVHAAQSVSITLSFAFIAIAIFCIQLTVNATIESQETIENASLFLGAFGSLAISFEIIYLRWLNARGFLRKNRRLSNRIRFFNLIVSYFKQRIFQSEPLQNVVTFGGLKPFLGSGEQIPGSSWTLPINRNDSIHVDSKDFYQAVDSEIARLDLPHLYKYSRLFVDGFELKADNKFLINKSSRPATLSFDDPLLLSEQSEPASRVRAYRVYQYVDTERDYILSHFLRFHNAGSITFVESSAHILPGIDRQRYSLTSTLNDSHFSRLLKTLAIAFAFFFAPVPFFPLYLWFALWHVGVFVYNITLWEFNDIKQRRAVELEEEYNYGIPKTFREEIAEQLDLEGKPQNPVLVNLANPGFSLFRFLINLIKSIFLLSNRILSFNLILDRERTKNFDYYGAQDVFMYWKAIQEAIFRGTIELLKENGVNTAQFEQDAASIVNYGVMVTASTISNSTVAASGAGGTVSQVQKVP
ncbi:MAG: FHA domain-containing protein [Cyanobacteria bacterium P01_F01_bin.150]